MPERLAHLPRCRAFLRSRFANISAMESDTCDAALALDLVLERHRPPAERRQLDVLANLVQPRGARGPGAAIEIRGGLGLATGFVELAARGRCSFAQGELAFGANRDE